MWCFATENTTHTMAVEVWSFVERYQNMYSNRRISFWNESWILVGVCTRNWHRKSSLISSWRAEKYVGFSSKRGRGGNMKSNATKPSDRRVHKKSSPTPAVLKPTTCQSAAKWTNQNLENAIKSACYLGNRSCTVKEDDVIKLTSGRVVKLVWQVCVQVLLAALMTFTNPLVITPYDWLDATE